VSSRVRNPVSYTKNAAADIIPRKASFRLLAQILKDVMELPQYFGIRSACVIVINTRRARILDVMAVTLGDDALVMKRVVEQALI
jgi:hypothetical protein